MDPGVGIGMLKLYISCGRKLLMRCADFFIVLKEMLVDTNTLSFSFLGIFFLLFQLFLLKASQDFLYLDGLGSHSIALPYKNLGLYLTKSILSFSSFFNKLNFLVLLFSLIFKSKYVDTAILPYGLDFSFL